MDDQFPKPMESSCENGAPQASEQEQPSQKKKKKKNAGPEDESGVPHLVSGQEQPSQKEMRPPFQDMTNVPRCVLWLWQT